MQIMHSKMFNGIMVTALIAAGLGLLAYNAEQLSETTGSLPGKVGKVHEKP